MPRLRTDETGVTWSLPTVSWFVGSSYCRRDDVHQRISVLVAFSCNLLELIQSATAEKHSDIRFSRQLVAPGWQNPYIWVSSAYKCGCRSYDWITITKSAVYNRNRRGPRTDPCGTPKSTIAGVDLLSLQRTNWVRWSKYDTNHWSTTPSRPYEISNQRSRILWSTESLLRCTQNNVFIHNKKRNRRTEDRARDLQWPTSIRTYITVCWRTFKL